VPEPPPVGLGPLLEPGGAPFEAACVTTFVVGGEPVAATGLIAGTTELGVVAVLAEDANVVTGGATVVADEVEPPVTGAVVVVVGDAVEVTGSVVTLVGKEVAEEGVVDEGVVEEDVVDVAAVGTLVVVVDSVVLVAGDVVVVEDVVVDDVVVDEEVVVVLGTASACSSLITAASAVWICEDSVAAAPEAGESGQSLLRPVCTTGK
jgi:hypothetical protein